jgi:hypothetical protein
VKSTFLYREASTTTELLDDALAKAQGEFKPVARNRTGPYGKFADLCSMMAATQAARCKYGLAVSQYFLTHEDRSMTLVTELACKGEFRVSAIPIPAFTNPQHTHSYCTYQARLGYARILCLAVDDSEDGEDLAEAESNPDLDGVLKAISQATTTGRLDQLASAVQGMKLSDPQRAQARDALNQQQTKVDAMERQKKGRRTNDTA